MEPSMCRLDAIILASGLSRRMGRNKLLLPLGNSTVIDQFLCRFPYTLFKKVIVVYRDQQVAEVAGNYQTILCHNQHAHAGKSTSIQLGLAASTAEDGMMFAVADQPLLSGATIRKLIESFNKQKFKKIIVPRVDGKPANPVIFPAACRSEFAELHGDSGGRQLVMKQQERVCYVSFPSGEEFFDVDTPENYQKIFAHWQVERGKQS